METLSTPRKEQFVPEKELMCAVIMRALTDLGGPKEAGGHDADQLKGEATAFFFQPEVLENFMEGLDVHPDTIRRYAAESVELIATGKVPKRLYTIRPKERKEEDT